MAVIIRGRSTEGRTIPDEKAPILGVTWMEGHPKEALFPRRRVTDHSVPDIEERRDPLAGFIVRVDHTGLVRNIYTVLLAGEPNRDGLGEPFREDFEVHRRSVGDFLCALR